MRQFVVLFLFFCFGCSLISKPSKFKINLVNNRTAVELKGLDYAVINEINRDTFLNRWQSLMPVYKVPADTSLMDYQPVQPGKYLFADSAVVFVPDTPFVKGKSYFLRYYKFGQGESTWDLIKGTKRPGKAAFTDLVFTD